MKQWKVKAKLKRRIKGYEESLKTAKHYIRKPGSMSGRK